VRLNTLGNAGSEGGDATTLTPETTDCRTVCPTCGAEYQKLSQGQVGQVRRCPVCGNFFQVRLGRGLKVARPAAASTPAKREAAPTLPLATDASAVPEPVSGHRAAALAEWEIGADILGLYRVTGFLGQGGMGRVFRVHHLLWDQDLAVKIPNPEVLAAAGGAESLEREAETWVRLELHPHVVSCYYVRRIGSVPCVFTEYVPGGDLHGHIYGFGFEPPRLYQGRAERIIERLLDIGIQFAWGLHFAHQQGLVHQDVKPANVLLDADGQAKVTDFGLAFFRPREAAVSAPAETTQDRQTGPTAGTPQYYAPEQAVGRPVTHHTDMWGWGLSMLEMFGGGRTWEYGTVAPAALEEHLSADDDQGRPPRMPAPLADLLRRCFRERPSERPPNMGVVARELVKIYEETTGREYQRAAPRPDLATADNLNNRAVSLLDLDRRDDAETLWARALAIDPHHPESIYNHGLLLWRSGRLDDETLLKRLVEADRSRPGEPGGGRLQALVHLERDDCGAALRALKDLPKAQKDEIAGLAETARQRAPRSRRLLSTLKSHPGNVHAVRLSQDMRRVFSAGDDGRLRVWDLASSREVQNLSASEAAIRALALGPGDLLALTGGGDYTTPDFALRLWDLNAGRVVQTMSGHERAVNALGLAADGKWAVSASDDQTVRVWDTAGGRPPFIFGDHASPVNAVAFSPDGRFVFSGGMDQVVRVWERETGRVVRLLKGHAGKVTALDVRGGRPLCLSGSADRTVRLWEAGSGRCLRVLRGHLGEVNAVRLSRDRRLAVSGGSDRTVRIWDLVSGRCLRTFEGHPSWVLALDLSLTGQLAVSGGVDGTLRVWRTTGFSAFRAPAMLCQVTRSEAAAAAADEYERRLAQARQALSGDRPALAADHLKKARGQLGYDRRPEAMALWNALYLRLPHGPFEGGWQETEVKAHERDVAAVAFSRDGRHVFTGSADRTIKRWEAADGRQTLVFEGHRRDVLALDLSEDGAWLCSGGADQTVRLWNTATGDPVRVMEGHQGPVNAVCFTPTGTHVLSAGEDRVIRVWETDTGRLAGELNGHRSTVNALCVAAGGRFALSAGGDHIGEHSVLILWDLIQGQAVRVFEGHERAVNAARLSPDGRLAVSGSSDQTLKVWDLAGGQVLHTLTGHTGAINAFSLSADGRTALSGSSDRSLRLWDLQTGRALRVFEGHAAPVKAVSLSQNGRYAASGAADGVLKLWALDFALMPLPSERWDERVAPYLEAFLGRLQKGPIHKGEAADLPRRRPTWTDKDFQDLLYALGCAGLGWLEPVRVRAAINDLIEKESDPV